MSTATAFTYVGTELDLFAGAVNWKQYVGDRIGPYLGQEVLEVGAGFGGTTRALCRGIEQRWVCLEPDPTLASRAAEAIRSGTLPGLCEVAVGTLATRDDLGRFDTILYMDVLEHIEDDHAEVERAAQRLRPGGHLIALSPAHPWLFTPFDAAIGHHRRYTRSTFGALASASLARVRLDYLDSMGWFASLANRVLLRKAMPTTRQIAVWDRGLVRLSRLVDPWLGYRAGKSVLAVWRKRST